MRNSILAAGLAALCGCAATVPLSGQPLHLAQAAGYVTTSVGKNGNTQLKVVISHLAKPECISSDGATFVVWALADGGDPQNLGAIKISNNLEGSLETLTPLKDFRLSVTAEAAATVQTPSSNVVLTTLVTRK